MDIRRETHEILDTLQMLEWQCVFLGVVKYFTQIAYHTPVIDPHWGEGPSHRVPLDPAASRRDFWLNCEHCGTSQPH